MINKNIQIWRGFETPPTNYHIWFKNGILSMFNGEAWVPIGSGSSLKTLDNSTYLDDCTQTGVVPYKQSSSQLPTGDYFTIFIQCPKDTDHNNYYYVQQTAYGRTGNASGRVWTRLCLVNTNGNYDNFDWVEITNPAVDLSGIESDIANLYDTVLPSIEQDIANLESGLLTEGSVTVDKLGDDVKDMITNSGVPVVNSSDALSADAVVGSFASIVVEGKTQLWVKNDTGWQEYGKESDPEEITNITDIL